MMACGSGPGGLYYPDLTLSTHLALSSYGHGARQLDGRRTGRNAEMQERVMFEMAKVLDDERRLNFVLVDKSTMTVRSRLRAMAEDVSYTLKRPVLRIESRR